MLIAHVERYLSLRQMLGYKLRNTSGNLRAFARFAAGRGDTHVRISTAMDWATEGTSPYTRHIRLRDAAQLARFLHAEDTTHEVPSNPFRAPKWRPLPYIYTPEEIVQLVGATSRLRESYPLRRQVYATMLGLIAATGLRISEALDLRLHDVYSITSAGCVGLPGLPPARTRPPRIHDLRHTFASKATATAAPSANNPNPFPPTETSQLLNR